MMRNQTTNFRNSAAQFFLGSIALALVTLVFFRPHVASAAFAYLIVIVLFSLMGSFIASALLAITSAAGLAYFFARPSSGMGMGRSARTACVYCSRRPS